MSSFVFSMNIIRVIVVTTGIFGNVLSFVIFSRKRFRTNSISTYCQALALIDCLTLTEIMDTLYSLIYNSEFNRISDASCKFMAYIPTIYNSIPVWILVAFSLDKLLNMQKKSSVKQLLQKKSFQWSLIAAIVLIHALLYIGMPIFVRRVETSPGVLICVYSTFDLFDVFMIVMVIETCFLPFIIMIVSSVLTIRLLYKSRRLVERGGKLTANRKSRDAKYAVSSVVFNFVFIPFKLPIIVSYINSSFGIESSVYFYNVALLLYFFIPASNLVVHLITNSLFRKELGFLFRSSRRVLVGAGDTTNSLVHLNRIRSNKST